MSISSKYFWRVKNYFWPQNKWLTKHITNGHLDKYQKMDTLDGQLFEGVVFNTAKTSFKVISLNYDQRK